jgi:predicted nucleotidyltransferase
MSAHEEQSICGPLYNPIGEGSEPGETLSSEKTALTKEDVRAVEEAARRHGVSSVRIFGSVVRGTATEGSDLDLLIEFEAGRDLFDLVALKQELEDKLGREVDVLTENSLSPYMRDPVLREAVPLVEVP